MALPACSTEHMLACPEILWGIRSVKKGAEIWNKGNDARQLPSRWLVSHGYRRNIASHL